MKYLSFFIILASCSAPDTNPIEDERPNILIIVADDLGYSDLGIYGGDISTPNIDALAQSGMLFTRFHTAMMCAPTRGMLFSGNENHVAGIGSQSGGRGIFANQWGYEGYLSDRIVPFPALLRESGYHTYISGKWHVGRSKETSPDKKGFERSWVMLNGAGNHYSSVSLFENDSSVYREDGKLVEYPEGSYSTEFYTDKLLSYIESNIGDGKPFLAMATLTSPHWPLQAPEEFDNYKGRYLIGYDSLRRIRFESLKKAGIIPSQANFPARLETITPWENLSDDEKRNEARKMELYAAMVENLDYHVGRMIQFLKEKELHDNTLIIFMSDNGAAGEDYYNILTDGSQLHQYYDNSLENMGNPNSFVSYGPQWAMAGAAPFNRYKTFSTEGGVSAPLIMSGPNITGNGTISHEYVTVMDIAPTLLELAGATYPEKFEGNSVLPMRGESMLPWLQDQREFVHDENYVTHHEHRLRFYVRKGEWKLVSYERPLVEENFQLFNLSTDLAESRDLKSEFPEKYQELLAEWYKYKEEAHIIIPD